MTAHTSPHRRNGTHATLLPPHNLEAEAALISCPLQNPALMSDLARHSPEIFYDLRHATLWQTLREMHRSRELIDMDSTPTLKARPRAIWRVSLSAFRLQNPRFGTRAR